MATAKRSRAPAKTPARKAAPARPAGKARPTAAAAPAPAAATTMPMTAAKAAPAATQPAKPKKAKLVRDSFTIPKAEYTVLQDLKQRAAKAGAAAKKSELLRAGIKVLAGMNDTALVAALGAVPAIKTGRPAGK
jgi:hypothetical protein